MQASSESVYVYMARQSYRGSGNNDPSMEVNDVIHVTAEFLHNQNIIPDNPDGWLFGINMRTGQEGYFPGYFLALSGIQQKATPQRRRPPPTPDGKQPYNDNQGYMVLGRVSMPGEEPTPPLYGGRRSLSVQLPPLQHQVPPVQQQPPSVQHQPPSVQHQLGITYFITPVLCSHCE
ncbi:serine/threonine-protein kinase Wnk [Cherax quadricarinatus]